MIFSWTVEVFINHKHWIVICLFTLQQSLHAGHLMLFGWFAITYRFLKQHAVRSLQSACCFIITLDGLNNAVMNFVYFCLCSDWSSNICFQLPKLHVYFISGIRICPTNYCDWRPISLVTIRSPTLLCFHFVECFRLTWTMLPCWPMCGRLATHGVHYSSGKNTAS